MRTLLLTLILPPQTPEAVALKVKAMGVVLLAGGAIECVKLVSIVYKFIVR